MLVLADGRLLLDVLVVVVVVATGDDDDRWWLWMAFLVGSLWSDDKGVNCLGFLLASS